MARKKTTEDYRTYRLRSVYGISYPDKLERLKLQGGVCAICGTNNPPARKEGADPWCVDHDHEWEKQTGGIKIRGILCPSCNTGIGHLKESVTVLASAIKYLEKYKSV